ncbi:MAG: hypothetical protein ACRDIE_01050 [Chloroflexota bacterium]
MNIVLDECLPRLLRDFLPGQTVRTVQELGAAGLKNGALLAYLSRPDVCDVLVTGDRNMPFQQSLALRPLAVVILHARTNRLSDLVPLMADLLSFLPEVRAGEVHEIGSRAGEDR